MQTPNGGSPCLTSWAFVLRGEDDYEKKRNYWKYLKAKLKRENKQLVSAATQLKITAADGKKYLTDTFDHPFMEGNGRSARIWLDLILKKNLRLCVDWSKIGKREYLAAMEASVSNAAPVKTLLKPALTGKINDRAMFIKGVDYSYYYEQEDGSGGD